jgi:hypothetical protein
MAGSTRFDHAQNQSTFQLRNYKAARSLTCLCQSVSGHPRNPGVALAPIHSVNVRYTALAPNRCKNFWKD